MNRTKMLVMIIKGYFNPSNISKIDQNRNVDIEKYLHVMWPSHAKVIVSKSNGWLTKLIKSYINSQVNR